MLHDPPEAPQIDAGATFDRMRGRLIDHFARAELAVSETLVLLSRGKCAVKRVDTPHLVGQRFEALDRALRDEGQRLANAEKVLAALGAFRRHDALRPILTHGAGRICRAGNGEHILILDVCSLTSAGEKRLRWWIGEAEVADLLQNLPRDARRLIDRLARLRAEIRVG